MRTVSGPPERDFKPCLEYFPARGDPFSLEPEAYEMGSWPSNSGGRAVFGKGNGNNLSPRQGRAIRLI
jgi:hypothetical protein